MADNGIAPAPPQKKKKREPRGSYTEVTAQFGARIDTIGHLWRAVLESETHVISPAIRSKRHLCGANPIYDIIELTEALKRVPMKKRKTTRAPASALGVSTLMEMKMKKWAMVLKHHSRLKPFLTEDNMQKRIEHRVKSVVGTSRTNGGEEQFYYDDLLDEIHIEEKWFYITRDGEGYILMDGENLPHRTCKHKSHITKLMFLCAMARPRWNPDTNFMWDGKIGIWPVGSFVPAQRSSRNRARGTPVWKNQSITRDVYRDLLTEKLLPAAIDKWPAGCTKQITIQQDGAKSHIAVDDADWLAALAESGWGGRVRLYTQPANSPDFNLNDLGFFRSLQSDYERQCPTNEGGIMEMVQEAFNAYDTAKINRIWLSLQCVFNSVLL